MTEEETCWTTPTLLQEAGDTAENTQQRRIKCEYLGSSALQLVMQRAASNEHEQAGQGIESRR